MASPKPRKTASALQAEIARLQAALHELNKKYQFKQIPGRPILVVQVGDPATGWLGDAGTIAFLIRELKQAGVDQIYNIVIYHYAANFQVIGGKS